MEATAIYKLQVDCEMVECSQRRLKTDKLYIMERLDFNKKNSIDIVVNNYL